ncbi:MAG: ABC transporter ATP-binding protein [Bacillota bacterium]
MDTRLSICGICKYFPGVAANEDVCIDVKKGEIHALLGENGAGKTTLMNCLYGMYTPDKGRFLWNGEHVEISNSADAIALGIGMVHQHFMLVQNLSVLENIILGISEGRNPFLNRKRIAKKLKQLIDQYGLEVDLNAQIWQLPVGVQQRVEIIKTLYRKAELLILDEPTAVLTPQEIRDLFKILDRLRKDGHSVILITHKLNEVMQITDSISVLRSGRVVGTLQTAETDTSTLAKLMVNREILPHERKNSDAADKTLLAVNRLCCRNDKGILALENVCFELKAGEILGVAGVSGNGQTELADVLSGLRKPTAGEIRLGGESVTGMPVYRLYERGLTHIPEDRHRVGLVLDFSVRENAILGNQDKAPFTKHGVLQRDAISEYADNLINKYDVRTPNAKTPARLLSGGNQQKIILGREIDKHPKVYIAAQPTRGLDFAATEYVQQLLLMERERGCGILYISTELDEILKMSDRIIVLYAGRQYGPMQRKDLDIEQLGLMMAGAYAADDGRCSYA